MSWCGCEQQGLNYSDDPYKPCPTCGKARLEADQRSNLFVSGEFISHSGLSLPFKIDCDALTDADIKCLAANAERRLVRFQSVHGIPRGGLRFADALSKYSTGSSLDPTLIVDDVLTTGRSMEEAKLNLGQNVIGVVIFARAKCPDWITPLFKESPLCEEFKR